MAKKSKCPLKPLSDNVLLIPLAADETTHGGIVLPQTADDAHQPHRGEIVDVGKDVRKVTIGDRVIYRQFAGDAVEFGDQKFRLVGEEYLIAIIL